jgi:2-C-methyl-D-erythritol 2,4-cyclodiphosphate synthase
VTPAAAGEPSIRVGFAHDRHPFGPAEPLRLGGLVVEGAPQLHGHSDGDVALHAVAGALLAAAGLEDLGTAFPISEVPRGQASGDFLLAIGTRLAALGWRPAQVDLTITGARPRLGDRLEAMRGAIAGMTGLPVSAVGVTASTGNLSGDDGAGRTISAEAFVTIARVGSE